MKIRKLGVLGAGTMGGGIAESAAASGFPAIMIDRTAELVDQALSVAARRRARAVERGRTSAAQAAATADRLSGSTRIEDLAECDLIVEAVYEDLDEKLRQFERLGAIARTDAILATNTSSLRVDDLAAAVREPSRFLGMHYFVPANANRLVEIVRGAATDEATIDAALAFARATGKEPLLCRDGYGFAVNRFFVPCVNEAVRLTDDGYESARVDRVSRETFGAPLGTLAVLNLSKPRIGLHSCRTLARLGRLYEPCAGLVRHGEADEPFELGEPPAADPRLDGAIADRLRGATFLPVLEALDEGVTTPEGIDLGARHGLRWQAAPCATMDGLGRQQVERILAAIVERDAMAMPQSREKVGRLIAR